MSPGSANERKDRLVQTRVPEKLEATLKQEAHKRRTTVSQMIRNILEDTFDLVDGVVASVDAIVSDSVELAQKVGRDVRRMSEATARAGARCQAAFPDAEQRLAGVHAWQPVVLNRPVACARCGARAAARAPGLPGRQRRSRAPGVLGLRSDRAGAGARHERVTCAREPAPG